MCSLQFEDLKDLQHLQNGIPKLIMQTWKNEIIPENWRKGQKSVQTVFKDWHYILMTDSENQRFVDTHWPEYSEPFRKLRYPIQRADAIRYMFLYTFGGMYMDLDFLVLKNFEHLLESACDLVLLHSGNVHWCLTNSLIICKPKQEVFLSMLKHCFENHLPWYYFGKHIQVMFSTGPMAFHKVITDSNTMYSVLPRSLFMPFGIAHKAETIDYNLYLMPLDGGTWNSIDSFVLNFLLQYKKEIAWLIGLGILFVIRGHLYYKFKTGSLMKTIRSLRRSMRYRATTNVDTI